MDIKWKKFSYSLTATVIAFIITVLCYSALLTIASDVVVLNNNNLHIAYEESYYLSSNYINESNDIAQSLRAVTEQYKSEENILNGGTLSEDQISNREDQLYSDFENNSKNFNPNLSAAENYQEFEEVYADKISQIREELIQQDLREYRATLKNLDEYQGLIYYVKSGESEFTNSPNHNKTYFKSSPSYIIIDSSEREAFPEEINANNNYFLVSSNFGLGPDDIMYIGFTEKFINPRITEWQDNKTEVTNSLYLMIGLAAALALAFIYLLFVIGRKPEDNEIHLNSVDKIYNDINIIMCLILIGSWIGSIALLYRSQIHEIIFAVTLIIAALGLILVLSLVKHIKNGTFIKHSLTYFIFNAVFVFIKDIFNSGSVAVKVILVVIFYPIIAGLAFFMLPITIGVAAWLALKQVKEFDAIKEGVKQVKEGNIHYTIDVPGDGEFAKLAADINTITDGLNKAVFNEIKSERLKSELITNVSHDIRTPLTSIITYVDLLKNEKDPVKVEEYIEVLDQKSQRLKVLTDDLFEATKASSGNIPVNYEKIDIVSLLTQGLGELDDQIQERQLEFKLSNADDKIYIKADGKLLWRAIENLLLNILKYALQGSRVYIDIIDSGSDITINIKNISAYELNISSDELMERFKRGDESRSSHGSGLGLSIAKSLIEIQQGSFKIEIDGDLFKAIIQMPKH